jgi:hypothetical protein
MFRLLIEVTVLLVLAVASPLPIRAEEPSLAETLQWMDNTFNRHGDSLGHGHWETYSVGKLFQRRDTRLTYVGSRMSLFTSGGLLVEDYQDGSNRTFNLGDIDPNSIHRRAHSSETAGIARDACRA